MGGMDLEAVETASAPPLHRAGAAALTQLLQFPKLGVAGSNLVSRSNFFNGLRIAVAINTSWTPLRILCLTTA
jgi:hypothetical protein